MELLGGVFEEVKSMGRDGGCVFCGDRVEGFWSEALRL